MCAVRKHCEAAGDGVHLNAKMLQGIMGIPGQGRVGPLVLPLSIAALYLLYITYFSTELCSWIPLDLPHLVSFANRISVLSIPLSVVRSSRDLKIFLNLSRCSKPVMPL